MAKNLKWQDEYWLLLMQIYLQKPAGIKPMYSREMVDLSMELHIAPNMLFNKMCQIANHATPRIEYFWELYGNNPRKLNQAVSMLREMWGFNNALEFYEGVETQESFERDFKPISADSVLTPMMLTLILDLYFRLTPITMVEETPEVKELAKMMNIKPQELVEALKTFQHCDPYLNRKEVLTSDLFLACRQIWRRYGNANPEDLASFAEQLKEYFK